ncbi:hypothetical protein DH2020_027660 [Rehmannia glutinosa]|uniref:MLO-like protein n=1 Tax=Rehmannia glutinosa TaxID=99300 RepID=A0ABR0VUJ1_REHGL
MAGGGGGEEVSLEYTPTWVVALVCTVIVAISLAAERILHYTGKSSFLSFLVPGGGRRLLATASDAADRCEKEGKAPLLSLKALHDLHIFIFVLALVHVVISALTILFGSLKIRQWKQWEDAIQKKEQDPEEGQKIRVTHVHQHDFIRARDNPKFNFYKYMVRAFEADFKKVVGISWYLWVFVVVFLLLNVGGWHAYFYIAFIPLILLIGVGTKLEHIITQLAEEVAQKHVAVTGDLVVKPSDHHFWFRKPRLVLVLIHVILFQNSFEIAVFFWMLVRRITSISYNTLWEIKHVYLINLEHLRKDICASIDSYSTLPLYAIVAQMGSSFNKAIFEEHIQVKLTGWAHKAKRNKGQRKAVGGGSTQTGNNESPSPVPSEVLVQESTLNEGRSLEIETITVSYDPK